MVIAAHHQTSFAEKLWLQVLGVGYFAVIALLVGLCIAQYQKAFASEVHVTLQAKRAGLQLTQFGDVRMHGVLVGQVRGVERTGDGVEVELALDPAAAESIPANVGARILPTTLFGLKYVSLEDPKHPSGTALADGDVIPESRSRVSVELNRVLAELFPLLRAVDPADLSSTLNALATALQGRGENIGRTIDRLDRYLTEFNGHLPALRKNLRLVADVAETYRNATPDLMRILRNVTQTSETVVDERDQLAAFFGDVTGVANTTTRVLSHNEDRLIRLGRISRPVLEVLATYAPEYPCLLKGIDRYSEPLSGVFRDGRIHQQVEILADQDPGYTAADRPEFGEAGHGPWCLGLPNPPHPSPPIALRDGSDSESAERSPLPTFLSGLASPASGFAGTSAEQRVVGALLAPSFGGDVANVPDIATLLYGPVIRGTVVSTA